MSWVVFAIVGWICFGLELGLRDGLQLGATGVAPSFVLVLLVIVAMSAPRMTVMWAALALGLVSDITRVRPDATGAGALTIIGPDTLGFALAAYAILTLRGLMMRRNVLTAVFLTLVAGVMVTVLATALLTVRASYDAALAIRPAGELFRGVGSAVYSAVAALALSPALLFLTPVFGFQLPRSRQRFARS